MDDDDDKNSFEQVKLALALLHRTTGLLTDNTVDNVVKENILKNWDHNTRGEAIFFVVHRIVFFEMVLKKKNQCNCLLLL